MSGSQRVSVLEDSLDLQKLLANALTDAGYTVRAYGRAQDFERELGDWNPELCIIDLGLPDKDGLGILGQISVRCSAAILIVSGRSSLSDKIAGLELGADDYLAKPFEMSELIARARALLRRTAPAVSEGDAGGVFRFSEWTADLTRFVLSHSDGTEDRLSASEAALLRIFLQRPNRLITRDLLRDELGERGDELSFDRAIDVRVSRLRAKLRDPSKDPKIIKTIYGAGYILISDVE